MKNLLKKIFQGYDVLESVQSPFNGKIEVREDIFGNRRIMVSGLTQSGPIVEKLWEKAFQQFVICNLKFEIKDILILGLAGGSLVRLMSKLFPEAKIVGVEIDPVMVELGKKHFELDKVENLKIEIADATKILNIKNKILNRFDLVLVDLYCGDEVPDGLEDDKFLTSLEKVLNSKGLLVVNRLYYGKKIQEADRFKEKLMKIFPEVNEFRKEGNKLFFCKALEV